MSVCPRPHGRNHRFQQGLEVRIFKLEIGEFAWQLDLSRQQRTRMRGYRQYCRVLLAKPSEGISLAIRLESSKDDRAKLLWYQSEKSLEGAHVDIAAKPLALML